MPFLFLALTLAQPPASVFTPTMPTTPAERKFLSDLPADDAVLGGFLVRFNPAAVGKSVTIPLPGLGPVEFAGARESRENGKRRLDWSGPDRTAYLVFYEDRQPTGIITVGTRLWCVSVIDGAYAILEVDQE